METHEVFVEGRHAATITVKSAVEMLYHVACIRAVYESAHGIESTEGDSPLAIHSRTVRIY